MMGGFVTLLGVIIVFLIYRHFSWAALPWPKGAMRPALYQGHRGFWRQGCRENTLASFIEAKRRGLQMIELDVRLSKDHIPVVFHDKTLSRFSDRTDEVQDCTAQDLYKWVGAPTLEDVLTSKDVPVYVNIELKTESVFQDLLESQVVEVVKRLRAQDRVLFSSFNPFSLRKLSRLLPEVPRALVATSEVDPDNNFLLRHLLLAPYARIHLLHLDHHFTDLQKLKNWIDRGVPVALWTVNDAQNAREYLSAGAISIISDELKPDQ